MQPILVTGGAGYIGSHVCKYLSQCGFLPITYDNLSTGHAYAVKWGPFVQGDLNDQAKLDHTIHLYQPKAVMHFAANALVVESMQNPSVYYRNNVGSTLSLLEAMHRAQMRLIVFSSSCATYGHPQLIPITEDHPQLPVNPYGRTKLIIEQMLNDFEMAYGFRSMQLRYFNAAGADKETQIGEDHNPETHLIPNTILTALGIQPELTVYGTDFPTFDGSTIRDYVHVHDLAIAHVLALQHLLQQQESLAFNLGTGTGHSTLQIIQAIEKYSKKKLPIRIASRRAGDPAQLVASMEKAKTILGWTPQCSNLHDLIDSAWKWQELLTQSAPVLQNTMNHIELLMVHKR